MKFSSQYTQFGPRWHPSDLAPSPMIFSFKSVARWTDPPRTTSPNEPVFLKDVIFPWRLFVGCFIAKQIAARWVCRQPWLAWWRRVKKLDKFGIAVVGN